MSKQLGDINRSLARAHRTLEHENDALIVLKDKLETAVDRNTGSSLTGKAWMAFDKIKRALGVSDPKKRNAAQLKLKALAKQLGEDIETTNAVLDEIDQLASSLEEKVYSDNTKVV